MAALKPKVGVDPNSWEAQKVYHGPIVSPKKHVAAESPPPSVRGPDSGFTATPYRAGSGVDELLVVVGLGGALHRRIL